MSLLDQPLGKENRHANAGIFALIILLVLFAVGTMLGFMTIQLVCYGFIAAAFVLMLVVPRLSPVKTTKYDDKTPMTSYFLGSRISSLSTNYLLLEIVVAAVVLYYKPNDKLMLVFYIQSALLIIYLSLLMFFTSHPGKGEELKSVDELTPEDVAPAQRPKKANDSEAVAHDRMDILAQEINKDFVFTKDAKLKKEMNKALAALKASPQDSYESMEQVEYQLSCIIGELGERAKQNELDEAIECCMLVVVLCDQRTALYKQIMDKKHQVRADAKAKKNKKK